MSTAVTSDKPGIGWIGLGKMGLPICERLAVHQFRVKALTRNDETRDRAFRANLQYDSTIRKVIDGAQIVVSAISDDDALLDIVFKEEGLRDADFRGDQHGLS